MSAELSGSSDQLSSVADRLNLFQNLEDRAQNFEALSRDMTNNLYILLRSAGIYDLDNQALDQAFESVLTSVSGLYDLLKSDVSIRLSDGNFFINRRLVKLDFSTYQNARYLIKIFDFLEVNELSFSPKLSRGDLKQLLTTFVHLLKEKKNNFKDLNIPNIEARKLKIGEIHPLLQAKTPPEKVAAWYATACFVTQNFYQDAADGRAPQHSLLKRTVLDLIEFPARSLSLLGRLDYLAEDSERGDRLCVHSVEAAGVTALITDAIGLSPELRLATTTAALQLFQGWSLLEKSGIKFNDPQALKLIFDALERPKELLSADRNDIVRALLDLGGVSESVIQRIMITFEAQRGRVSQWYRREENNGLARPSRAVRGSSLYRNGLERSFLTDIVYGAHLYCYLRRHHDSRETWKIFNESGLCTEVAQVFWGIFGVYPYGSRVLLNNGKVAIVTSCSREGVEGIAIINHGGNPLKASVEELMEIRSTSPIQVERPITDPLDSKLSSATVRALIFSRLFVESQGIS